MLSSWCPLHSLLFTRLLQLPELHQRLVFRLRPRRGSFLRYLLLIITVIAVGAAICFLDGYLKCKSSGPDGKRTFTSRASLTGNSVLGFMEDCVDIGSLLRIQAIIMPMIFWSLFYSLARQRSKGSDFQATIEVISYDSLQNAVSRYQAKQNLHLVRETNARRSIENVIFDRFWYQNRE